MTARDWAPTAAAAPSARDARAPAPAIAPLENVRLSDPDRLEAFSDGVFAITITLLVIDIVRPEYEPGRLWQKLVAQWPNYLAFLGMTRGRRFYGGEAVWDLSFVYH